MQQILPPSSVGWRRKKHGVLGFATCVSVCKTLRLRDPIVCPNYWGPQIGERHAETEVEDLGGNWRQWNCSVELVALFQHVQADVAGALLKYTHGCTEMQHKNIQGCWAHNCSSKETQRHKFSTTGLGKNTHITSWIQSLDKPALTVDKLTFASSLRASFVRSVPLPQDRLDELFVQWSFDTFWHCAARSLDLLSAKPDVQWLDSAALERLAPRLMTSCPWALPDGFHGMICHRLHTFTGQDSKPPVTQHPAFCAWPQVLGASLLSIKVLQTRGSWVEIWSSLNVHEYFTLDSMKIFIFSLGIGRV